MLECTIHVSYRIAYMGLRKCILSHAWNTNAPENRARSSIYSSWSTRVSICGVWTSFTMPFVGSEGVPSVHRCRVLYTILVRVYEYYYTQNLLKCSAREKITRQQIAFPTTGHIRVLLPRLHRCFFKLMPMSNGFLCFFFSSVVILLQLMHV